MFVSWSHQNDTYFVPQSLTTETPRAIRLNLYGLTTKDMEEIQADLSRLNIESNVNIEIAFRKQVLVASSVQERAGQDQGGGESEWVCAGTPEPRWAKLGGCC